MIKCGASNLMHIFSDEFNKESDRACVILSAAMIENELENLLKRSLIPSTKRSDDLFDTATSPLGNFSSKIIMAYRLGIISKKLYNSINIIRKIRNQFAHDIYECNFGNEKVKDKVRQLENMTKIVEQEPQLSEKLKNSPRNQFQLICTKILFYLSTGKTISSITPCTEKPDEWIFGNTIDKK